MHARRVSGDELESLGKEAARRWACGEHKDLSNAVVETVKQARLSPEQVRRVVEFTNTNAFLDQFRKEGTSHKYIDFGEGVLANPSRVLQDLNDGSGGTVFDTGDGDYHNPAPKGTKQASAKDGFDKTASGGEPDALELALQSPGYELPYANPYQELFEVKHKLAAEYDTTTSARTFLEGAIRDLSSIIYDEVKTAMDHGHSLGEVANVWSQFGNEEQVKLAFDIVVERLYQENVVSSVDQVVSSLQKTAGAQVVNPSHPLVSNFRDFCEVTEKYASVYENQQVIGEGLKQANLYLNKLASPASQAAKSFGESGALQSLGRGWKSLADTVGHHGGELGKALLGTTAEGKNRGAFVGTAGKLLTYAAPVVMANNMLSRLAPYRALKNAISASTPGTEDYYLSQQGYY